MTPSEQCKQAGLKSLAEMSELTTFPIRTLQDYHRYKLDRFEVLLIAAVEIKKQNTYVQNQNT